MKTILETIQSALRAASAGAPERRFVTRKIELRAGDAATDPRMVRGYAAVFGSKSENLGTEDYPFFEIMEPGAFDDVLADDVRALFNHDENLILARSAGGKGTLRIFQDDTGLGYEFAAPDTSYARDLVVSLDRGDVDQSSFAFRLKPDGDRWVEESGIVTRTIKRGGIARLYDVSPVTYPAYADTEAHGLRSLRGLPKPAPIAAFSSITIRRHRLALAEAEGK
jgi:HK97 family phage prohead protease